MFTSIEAPTTDAGCPMTSQKAMGVQIMPKHLPKSFIASHTFGILKEIIDFRNSLKGQEICEC